MFNAFKLFFAPKTTTTAFKNRTHRKLQLLSLEQRIVPATFTVSITGDSGAGSLRQAIIDANAAAGADTIVFAAGLTASAPATINLSTSGDGTTGPSAFGITSEITITGPNGANGITLNNTFVNQRLFYVSAAGKLTLDSLTLSGGKAQGGNGGNGTLSGGGGAAGMGGDRAGHLAIAAGLPGGAHTLHAPWLHASGGRSPARNLPQDRRKTTLPRAPAPARVVAIER
jgi:hypothetical protein